MAVCERRVSSATMKRLVRNKAQTIETSVKFKEEKKTENGTRRKTEDEQWTDEQVGFAD